MKLHNVTHAAALQKQLTIIASKSLQRALHRANQASKNARSAPHIETATIALQLERAQNATRRARVFYLELKKRSALTKQAEAAIVRMKERVEDQKAQCKGFSKNLKEKKVEEVDGGVESSIPGPEMAGKLGKKLPPWLKTYLKKNGWRGPGDSKLISAVKKASDEGAKNEVEASPSAATAATGASTSASGSHSNSAEEEDGDEEESKGDKKKAAQASEAADSTGASGPSATDHRDAETKADATGTEDATGKEGVTGTATGASTGSATGASTGSATGASTGSASGSTGSSDKNSRKGKKQKKLDAELKEANNELVSLEKQLKMPVEKPKKEAKSSGIEEANKELKTLEKELKMPVEKDAPSEKRKKAANDSDGEEQAKGDDDVKDDTVLKEGTKTNAISGTHVKPKIVKQGTLVRNPCGCHAMPRCACDS